MTGKKFSTIIISVIWTLIALFLYFRPIDGAGIDNNALNKLVSLSIWIFVGLIIFCIDLIYWNHHN